MYRKFMCMEDCESGVVNYVNNTIFKYKAGNIYGYHYTNNPKQKQSVYTEDRTWNMKCGSYTGMVTKDFIDKHFIPYDSYLKELRTVDELFDSFMKDIP